MGGGSIQWGEVFYGGVGCAGTQYPDSNGSLVSRWELDVDGHSVS